MLARFFIDRPIFAAVLSIVMTLAGGIAVFTLPIAQYPAITPPTIQVDCRYPGASATVVSETIASPIEQQVNGVEGMLYMSSQCTNDGSYNLTVTFQTGVDLNMAQVLVQNRVSLAIPSLPEVIKQTGVTTRKRSPDILLSVNINAPDGRYDQLFLSNYALTRLRDELVRLPGVSDVLITGQRDYSMRIWLDADKMAARNLTASDVVAALRSQNIDVATGQVGQPPTPSGQPQQITLDLLGRLRNPYQFADIILRSTPEGHLLRLGDVARVTLGAKSEDVTCRLDGKTSVGMPVFQLPDANALDVARAVKTKMKELSKDFPEGLIFEIQYDTTPFISQSIREVYFTLAEAVVLVAIVVLVFLQSWRSAVIPLIAVPVAIVGTFAVMAVVGFSLNNLTLFGLVLAIGIVVDDAIVVVEAVEHHIERGLAPHPATVQAMKEVSGPIIAVAFVLCAVFVPCAFIRGITGSFFRQFALTIAVSTVISTFNSLTLSPALAARLLRSRHTVAEPLPRVSYLLAGAAFGLWVGGPFLARRLALDGWSADVCRWATAGLLAAIGLLIRLGINHLLTSLLRGFDRVFAWLTTGYLRLVRFLVRRGRAVLIAYATLVALTLWGLRALPTGFIPAQDMGYLLVNVQLPDAASLERTDKVMRKLERIALDTPGVNHVLTVTGQSFLLSAFGSNFGSQFVLLDDYDKRLKPELYGEAIAASIRKRYASDILEATPVIFSPPPVRGVGRAGGFKLMLEDRGDIGPSALQEQTDGLVEQGNRQPNLTGLFSVFRANSPQIFVDLDRTESMTRGVPLREVFDTLQVYLGSLYVNDFGMLGRTWQVVAQAESKFRDEPRDVARLRVRNSQGEMVPLGAIAGLREINSPLILTRYNMYPAAAITGNTVRGVSSGQGIALMNQLARRELPASVTTEWTEMAFLELQAGNTALMVFAAAVVMVFLVLAALYESWALPLAVILVMPMCLLSAITGVWLASMDINIFTQVGFVVLVGLASKNAILIVEFARTKRQSGASAVDAALEACQLRVRPIVMTSLAFILGVLPLVLATGAGAEMRRTLGTAVFSGMLGVTLFGLVLTPVFFVVIDGLTSGTHSRPAVVDQVGRFILGVLSLRMLFRFLRRLPATLATHRH
ncbi:MAG: multidrug efflux RND transporter permease subunit [Gemmataceae bacterium]|nr:multidrug efflux RND transporter permease subunit [Gemmataceae bacterium]